MNIAKQDDGIALLSNMYVQNGVNGWQLVIQMIEVYTTGVSIFDNIHVVCNFAHNYEDVHKILKQRT